MTKNLKLSFILLFITSAIVIAWRSLTAVLGGVGLVFVGLLTTIMILLAKVLTDKNVYCRVKDLFFIACGFGVLELIIYFAFQFPTTPNFDVLEGFLIVQNVFSGIAILFFAYTTFRFVCEIKGAKIGFIELILGNEKPVPKVKKSKEIFNGSLEDKPVKHADPETTIQPEQPTEETIEEPVEDVVIEQEEESSFEE